MVTIGGLITAILALAGMVLKWYIDPNRLRGVALNVKKTEGKAVQTQIDTAIAEKDFQTLSAVLQRLHDSRRVLSDKDNTTGSDKL